MGSVSKPKALREDYSPAPFIFQEQASSGESRLVAWTSDMDQLRRLFQHLLLLLPDTVEVLLKVEPRLASLRDDDDGALANSVDDWDRFFGACPRSVLLRGLATSAPFILQDSRCQLLVRSPASHEYIVLDEVGVVYIYSIGPTFQETCAREGFHSRKEELIRVGPHWRHCVKDGPLLSRRFIKELALQKVRAGGEIVPIDGAHLQ